MQPQMAHLANEALFWLYVFAANNKALCGWVAFWVANHLICHLRHGVDTANFRDTGGGSIYLYHYYDDTVGPFTNLSELPPEEAKTILADIKLKRPNSQSAQRHENYVEYRRNCENIVQNEFLKSKRHYMVVEHSPWLSTWFENCAFIKIPINEFDLSTVSFTYGDSMPTFSPQKISDREYFHKVYTYEGILKIIAKYGLPQNWNDDGKHGYERYIEAHVWSDETISKYR